MIVPFQVSFFVCEGIVASFPDVGIDVITLFAVLRCSQLAQRHAQQLLPRVPEGLTDAVIGGEDAFFYFIGHRLGFIVHTLVLRAKIKHNIRCTFHSDYVPILVLLIRKWGQVMRLRIKHTVNGDHALAFRVKWDFIFARIGFVNINVDRSSLGCGYQQ